MAARQGSGGGKPPQVWLPKALLASLRGANLRLALVGVAVAAVLPVALVGAAETIDDRNHAADTAKVSAMRFAALVAADQDEVVDGTRQLLATLAQVPDVSGNDPSACSSFMAGLLSMHPIYATLGVIAPDGRLVCNAVPAEEVADLSQSPYFRRAVETRALAVGDFEPGGPASKPSLRVALPILSDTGEVQGMVFAAIDLDWLNAHASREVLPEDSALLILDRNGTVLARSPDAGPGTSRPVPDAALTQAIVAAIQEGATDSSGLDGVRRFIGFAPIAVDGGPPGGYVVVGFAAAPILADANEHFRMSLVVGALAVVAGAAMAWSYGSRWVWRPVRTMMRASNRLASGDLTARSGMAELHGEMGALAQSFDSMARALEAKEVERGRLHAQTERAVARLALLRTLDRAMLDAEPPDAFSHRVVHGVRKLVPCAAASLLLYDHKAGEARVVATDIDPAVTPPSDRRTLPLSMLPDLDVLRKGELRYIPDLSALTQRPRVLEALANASARSLLSAPLLADGDLLGVLTLLDQRPHAFDPEAQEVIREVARQMGVALTQQRLRADLESERQRLLTVVEHLRAGVVLLDRDCHALLRNPEATRCLEELAAGYEADRLTTLGGVPVNELVQTTGTGLARELTPSRSPQRTFAISVWGFGNPPGPSGYVMLVRDTTQERDQERQLRQQERLAAVGQLAAGIAHDFNNHLAAMLGYAELLEMDDDLPPRARDRAGVIVRQGGEAARLVRDILAFSRPSSAQRVRLPVEPFLKETVKLIQRTVPPPVRVRYERGGPAGSDCALHVDPVQMRQILLNLATNARDAMPEGGDLVFRCTHVDVSSAASVPAAGLRPGAWVRIDVADTGTGIPPEVLPRIFEPFFTTKAPGKGTGLGLSQVYRIVEAHGGQVRVASQVGHGTTFSIFLPLAAGEEPGADGAAGETLAGPAREAR